MKNTLLLLLVVYTALLSLVSCSPTYEQLYSDAENNFLYLKQVYEFLHTIPELSYEEQNTSLYIQQQLAENGITFSTGWGYNRYNKTKGGTGIIAQIGNGKGPCFGLRADIDALPIQELVDVPYKSTNEGKMHACGHDSHATMLLGAAKLLKKYEDQINGTVKFFFQPAEEVDFGAMSMIEEGAMDLEPKPQGMFAFHVSNLFPTGTIATTPGPITAALSGFDVTVKGRGGHAAMHHLSIDPISIMTTIAQSINTMSARELYFTKANAGVVSITNLYTGNTNSFNVIPNEMKMKGTLRALNNEVLQKLESRVKDIAEQTALASNASAVVEFPQSHLIPTINNPQLYEFFKTTMGPTTTNGKVQLTEPHMIGEDFAYFADRVPSVLAFLGIRGGTVGNDHPTDYPLHNPNFAVDENVLPYGASMYAYFGTQALNYLNENSPQLPQQQYDEL